jgi:hypothetical protein
MNKNYLLAFTSLLINSLNTGPNIKNKNKRKIGKLGPVLRIMSNEVIWPLCKYGQIFILIH